MYLLGKVGSPEQKARFLEPLVSGKARSAFFMTEPADEGGAGSDPSMMQTTCRLDGNHWVINGRKKFITGAEGARVGIVMAKSDDGACMFLVDLPDAAIRTLRVLDTIDSSMPGDHAEIEIEPSRLRRPDAQRLRRWFQIRANPPQPGAPVALHALARPGDPRQRDRHRLCLPPPRIRKTAGRS
jgi:alkylation response protein AidB-like acyl-CoA dehydrogenase